MPMKVKALSRSAASTERQNSGDLRMHHRNLDPSSHPMARAREYTRAVTAAKLDRMFAKPFLASLGEGHRALTQHGADEVQGVDRYAAPEHEHAAALDRG